jgi:hypothetical protein
MKEYCIDTNKLSEATVNEIQDLIGTDLGFIIPVDKNCKPHLPLLPGHYEFERQMLNEQLPTQGAVSSVETVTLLRATSGSSCWCWICVFGVCGWVKVC